MNGLKSSLLCLVLSLSLYAQAHDLVIATTLTRDALAPLLAEWEKQPNAPTVHTLNRTSQSLTQRVLSDDNGEIDLIISSSPMLFYNLQQQQKLAPLTFTLPESQQFVPNQLQQTTVAFSLSGFGLLINRSLLENSNLPLPLDWQDLKSPQLRGKLIISSPTRSDTNHIMLEALLQQYGWQQGWALINELTANVTTISSRSFGVVEKVQNNLAAVGITIDNYAHLITKHENDPQKLTFRYFDSFPISPTFAAVTRHSRQNSAAERFLHFLLSPQGQALFHQHAMGKLPILPLSENHPQSAVQKRLFSQPALNYQTLIERQHLVKTLFEQSILFRFQNLQNNWRTLHALEQQTSRHREDLREILTALPVSSVQAEDQEYLANFDHHAASQAWQQFFLNQQRLFDIAITQENTPDLQREKLQ